MALWLVNQYLKCHSYESVSTDLTGVTEKLYWVKLYRQDFIQATTAGQRGQTQSELNSAQMAGTFLRTWGGVYRLSVFIIYLKDI